eukprot:57440-Rhodomonas_salina.1
MIAKTIVRVLPRCMRPRSRARSALAAAWSWVGCRCSPRLQASSTSPTGTVSYTHLTLPTICSV